MTDQAAFDEKVRDVFQEFAIDKALTRRMGISGDDRHVPSYVMDWIVTRKSRGSGSTGTLQQQVQEFIKAHLPAKGDKERVKFRLSQGEELTILDAITVRVKLGKQIEYLATVPCLDENNVQIDASIIEQNQGLLQGSTWGATRLRYDDSGDTGGIRIIDFKPMQTGRVSLDAFLDCRKAFTVEEWIDLIVRTMGYEPTQYGEQEKLWLICRLIPIVQSRVNMMELAPPGSGKSYVYNNISRHVWLTAAEISPAVLFYNRQSRQPGLLTRFDLLVLDEAQSIRFSNPAEIQAQLKGYLEQGVFTRGDCTATAECGMMLLANIGLTQDERNQYYSGKPKFLPARADFIRRLPDIFLESPLLDRFHGIIPGWEIPPFETSQQANGYGLKADFFAEVCHSLRSASHLTQDVRAKLRLSGGKRDCTAVERMASGLAKLLLIGPDHQRFYELVVRPAKELRRLVRTQLHQVDAAGYSPELTIRSPESQPKLGRMGKYDLLEEIARGGMACVYKALDRETRAISALKKVITTHVRANEASIQREVDIYMRIQNITCRHLLSIIDVFREEDTYALVTEYADGGSLWELIFNEEDKDNPRILSPSTARDIALQITEGIRVLHEHGIVHRDLKPQNILQCDTTWKIADFGISKFISKPVTGYTFQGAHTMPWAPPEQIQGAQAHPSADIYSLGKIITFLLTGKPNLEKDESLEDHWAQIVTPCVAIDPDNRPDVSLVQSRLQELNI
ncbi:MAG TPA: BREX system Lon protease-like protein BrxL [Planctomycetaceae bacterium]|nr:BREX system Lon protease-like protein BrxL [Planctomycetaceae bacterium]